MTMRTVTKLKCECGHEGRHVLSENDQPYSEMWESNSLEGFNGGGKDGSDCAKMHCPACGKTGRVMRI
jgi:hypothetical protein